MRQLRTCDFCGDDPTGLYEPLPDSIPDGPRLLLCDGCRDRLASVVDPLLDRIEGSGGSMGPVSDAGAGRAATGRRYADTYADDDADAGATGSRSTERGSTGSGGVEATQPGDPASDVPRAEGTDAGGRPLRDRGGTPKGYRKVMRFLENRELPVGRAEAERLASEAYELDDETISAAIDHAVEYGRLREVDGELKR